MCSITESLLFRNAKDSELQGHGPACSSVNTFVINGDHFAISMLAGCDYQQI